MNYRSGHHSQIDEALIPGSVPAVHWLRSPLLQAGSFSLILLFALFYFNWNVHQQDLKRTALLGEMIYISGRQRMLSQRIAKNLLLLSRGSEQLAIYSQLQADLETLNQHQQLLLNKTNDLESSHGDRQLTGILKQLAPHITSMNSHVVLFLNGHQTASEILPAVLSSESQLVPLVDSYNQNLANQKLLIHNLSYQQQFLKESLLITSIGIFLFIVSFNTLIRFQRRRLADQKNKKNLTDIMRQIENQKQLLSSAISASRHETWSWIQSTGEFQCSVSFWKAFRYQQPADYPASEFEVFRSHIDPENSGLFEEMIERALKTDNHLDFEVLTKNMQGGRQWLRIQGELICADTDQGGTLSGTVIAGTVEDIHEYKLAKLQLVQNEKLLTKVGQLARVGGWYFEFKSRNLFWSAETYAIHEVEPDFKPSIQNTYAFYPCESRPVIQEALERAMETGESWDLKLPFITARGRSIWVRVQGEMEYDEHGQPVQLVGTLQDITEEKQHEAEILKLRYEEFTSRSHLEGVISAATELSIIATDPEGLITLFSPGAERLLGYSAEEMIGHRTPEVFHLKEEVEQRGHELTESLGRPVKNFEVFIATIKSDGFDRREWTYVCKDGTYRTVELTVTAICGKQNQIEGYVRVAFDITEKKEIEQKLNRLATAVGKSTNGMILTDPQGRIEWINDAFTKITGYELEEVKGKTPGSILQGAETDQNVVQEMRTSIQQGASFEVEIINYHKSGAEYWIQIKADPIFDHTGTITGFMAIENDITARKYAEHELRESRENIRRLLDALPVAAYTCDNEGLITYFNQAATHFWGRTPELLSPADRFCGSFKLFTQEGEPISHKESCMAVALQRTQVLYGKEIVVECADGTRKTALVHANPLFDCRDNITGAVNVLIDISERIQLEKSLRETTARLGLCQKVLDQHAIIVETDLQGTIGHVNDMFSMVSGYQREEVIGQTNRLVNSGFHSKEFWFDVFETISETGMWQGAICNRRKNGETYWVDTTIAAMRDGEGKSTGYLAIHNDITELIEAQEAALSASRSKSEFLANMSHEIRTPLTAILGYADLLKDDPDFTSSVEKRDQAVNTIQEAGNHLLTVINDILDLSKIEAGKIAFETTVTGVFHVLDHIESLLRPPAIEKGVELITQIETPIPDMIESDPTRLRQILMNLVGNAVKFTGQGSIKIIVNKIDLADKIFLQFDIEDSGPGMSEQQAEKMFQAFSQADSSVTRQHGGTGLGLVISRKLARLMEGDVTLVWTEAGRGTCFRFVLPIRVLPQTVFRTSRIMSDCNEVSVNKQGLDVQLPDQTRILLAEDGPDNQRLISFLLKKLGAIVEVADNGVIACEKYYAAEAAKEPFDLILTDMQMPEMDGYTLARTLRSAGISIPIIALTAHAMSEDKQKCLDVGCDDYLSKPVNKNALGQTILHWVTAKSIERAEPGQ